MFPRGHVPWIKPRKQGKNFEHKQGNNQGDHVYRDEHMHGGCVLRKPKMYVSHLLNAQVQLS